MFLHRESNLLKITFFAAAFMRRLAPADEWPLKWLEQIFHSALKAFNVCNLFMTEWHDKSFTRKFGRGLIFRMKEIVFR